MTRKCGRTALFLLLLSVAAPAAAQFPGVKIKVNVPGSDKRIQEADEEFRKGLDVLPRHFGENVPEEEKAVAQAEKHLDAGKSKRTADTKLASRYGEVDGRRATLETGIAQAKAMLACGRARAEIFRHYQSTGEPAIDDQIKALEDAVAAFAARVPAGDEPGARRRPEQQKRGFWTGPKPPRSLPDGEPLDDIRVRVTP